MIQEPGPGAYSYNNGVGAAKNLVSTKFGTSSRDANLG